MFNLFSATHHAIFLTKMNHMQIWLEGKGCQFSHDGGAFQTKSNKNYRNEMLKENLSPMIDMLHLYRQELKLGCTI